MASQARLAFLAEEAARAARSVLDAGLGVSELALRLEKVVEEVLGAAFSGPRWEARRQDYLRELQLFAAAHPGLTLGMGAASPAGFAARLAEAELAFGQAAPGQERERALEALRDLVAERAREGDLARGADRGPAGLRRDPGRGGAPSPRGQEL
jgi:hypothetical protein